MSRHLFAIGSLEGLMRNVHSQSRMRRLISAVLTGIAVVVASAPALSQLGSPTLAPPPERETLDQNHVDVMSGAVSLTIPEASIGDDATGLQLVAYYNSQGAVRDNYGGMLTLTTSGAQFAVSASWGTSAWTFPDQTGYSLSGDGATVGVGASTAVVTLRDGTVLTYTMLVPQVTCPSDQTCQTYYFPTQAVRPDGLTITLNYRTYNPAAPNQVWLVRVQSVTSNAGYQIKYNYQGNDPTNVGPWQRVTSAVVVNNAVEYCDPAADTCSFTNSWPTVTYTVNQVDISHVTSTITDALNRSTRFTLAGTSLRVKTAASASDNLQYTLQSFVDDNPGPIIMRVISATVGLDTWNYSFLQTPANQPPYNIVLTRSDPQSHAAVFTSQRTDVMSGTPAQDPVWMLSSVKDALNHTTSYTYPCQGSTGTAPYTYPYLNTSAFSATLPEGNSTARACDARGNVTSVTLVPKTGSGPNNIVNSWTFPSTCTNPKTCNQPSAFIDGRGFETDYTYDPTHGGVLTETQPAINVLTGTPPALTAVRPQKRYSYGQFYAYVKNASGTLVQAATPVWMPIQISECRTSSSCANGSDEVITKFEYAATGAVNRLSVRGKVVMSGGVSQRTCYSYDPSGNRISVTTPRAGLTTCP